MRSIPLAVILVIALSGTARAESVAVLEPRACEFSGMDDCRKLATALVTIVEFGGNTCTSVSSIRRWYGKAGFTVKCNHYRYEYEVEDHGGKLQLTVKD